MYLGFYNTNNEFIIPLVKDEYRCDQNTVNFILQPPFNHQLPEEEYVKFSSGKSELTETAKGQFDSYLSFCFDKVNNWEELRDAYHSRRLAVVTYDDDVANPIWVAIPESNSQPIEPEPMPIEYVPVVVTQEVAEAVPSAETPVINVGDLTLAQAIALVKQKATELAEDNTNSDVQLATLKSELADVERHRDMLLAHIKHLEEKLMSANSEMAAIADLAAMLKPFIN